MSDVLKPNLDLKTPYTTPPAVVNVPFVDLSIVGQVIDLNNTIVTDGTTTAFLSSVFKGINGNQQILIDSGAIVSDGTNEAPFDFEYDGDGKKFGAGTAFLQD